MDRKLYFEVKAYSREYLCDGMKEKRTYFVELDKISKKIENILGMNRELNSLKIISNEEDNFEIKQPDEIKYYKYELVKQLTKEEINSIKDKNKNLLNRINNTKKKEETFWKKHDQEQLEQWMDFFDHTAKQEPKFYFDKEGNLAEY